jgi:hypothetical protein
MNSHQTTGSRLLSRDSSVPNTIRRSTRSSPCPYRVTKRWISLPLPGWLAKRVPCLVAILDGGRPVVVLRTPEGRWAACNAFFSDLSSTPEAAGRRLSKLLKRRRRGYVAWMPVADTRPEEVPGFAMACGRGWDAEASDAGSHSEVSPALHPWACAGCKKKPA